MATPNPKRQPAARDDEVGADIEKIKTGFEYKEVIKHYFSMNEQQQIICSPNPTETFYKFWTRKESVIKATGIGISDELKNFEICSGENESKFPVDYFVLSFMLENFYGSVCTASYKQIRFFKP